MKKISSKILLFRGGTVLRGGPYNNSICTHIDSVYIFAPTPKYWWACTWSAHLKIGYENMSRRCTQPDRGSHRIHSAYHILAIHLFQLNYGIRHDSWRFQILIRFYIMTVNYNPWTWIASFYDSVGVIKIFLPRGWIIQHVVKTFSICRDIMEYVGDIYKKPPSAAVVVFHTFCKNAPGGSFYT